MRHETAATLLALLTGVIVVTGQTFQYSRGWTNGRKRASNADAVFIPPYENNLDDTSLRNAYIKLMQMLMELSKDSYELPVMPDHNVRRRSTSDGPDVVEAFSKASRLFRLGSRLKVGAKRSSGDQV